ncbi:MAG: hypothetical protein IKP07_04240 [Bacilli bacterium]|jgi:hypothetical protein|nr:hypothetical protein [Bacilli bacterium]
MSQNEFVLKTSQGEIPVGTIYEVSDKGGAVIGKVRVELDNNLTYIDMPVVPEDFLVSEEIGDYIFNEIKEQE